jgi:hypothetical protein
LLCRATTGALAGVSSFPPKEGEQQQGLHFVQPEERIKKERSNCSCLRMAADQAMLLRREQFLPASLGQQGSLAEGLYVKKQIQLFFFNISYKI